MMRQAAFLLLMLVSVSAFLKKPQLSPYEKFQKFKNSHILAKKMHVNECFNMLKTREINQVNKKCKSMNTFVQAPVEDIVKVCQTGEEERVKNEVMFKSRDFFNIIVCTLTEEGMFPKCKYSGESKQSKILIKCIGLPVHYHNETQHDDDEAVVWEN